MVVRRLQYIVNSNEITPASEQFAGSQGDKSATALDFKLSDDLLALVNQENIYYRFDGYDTEGNVLRGDSAPLDNDKLSYVLSEQLTRFGGKIQVYLIITQSVEGKTEMELYNFPARMRLNSLPSGGDIDKTEYESLTTLAESAKSAADKLLGDNVFVFGGGNAYDENIWPPTTDEVHNPETNLVQSKRPITSKGVFAAFKAFYERIIQAIDDKFALHKDYIVEYVEDGRFTYEKRNSGVVKCWYVGPAVTISWEGDYPLYYSTNTIGVHFPEGLFISTPCITPSLVSSGGAYITANPLYAAKTGITFAFTRVYGGNDDIQVNLHLNIVGRWK